MKRKAAEPDYEQMDSRKWNVLHTQPLKGFAENLSRRMAFLQGLILSFNPVIEYSNGDF